MKRRVMLPVLTAAAVTASLVVAASPAYAHGYVVTPQSRQGYCADNKIESCGEVIWEPYSVEGPKGSTKCSGGSRFRELDDESRKWPATKVGNSVEFKWYMDTPHATRDYDYIVGDKVIANIPGNGKVPPKYVTHTINLNGLSGRIRLLARWNISDTAMAFYSCVDLEVGALTPTVNPA